VSHAWPSMTFHALPCPSMTFHGPSFHDLLRTRRVTRGLRNNTRHQAKQQRHQAQTATPRPLPLLPLPAQNQTAHCGRSPLLPLTTSTTHRVAHMRTGLYINELMAKKFSLLGCVALMIASLSSEGGQSSGSFSGMLLESRGVSNRICMRQTAQTIATMRQTAQTLYCIHRLYTRDRSNPCDALPRKPLRCPPLE